VPATGAHGPVVVVAHDAATPEALGALISEVAATGGQVRIAAGAGDRVAFEQAIAHAGLELAAPAPVEILTEPVETVARPGDFVLAARPVAAALAGGGCVPLDAPVLPANARTAAGRLAAAIGWTSIEWIAECRVGNGYADEARMFLRALDEAGLEPALTGYANEAPRTTLATETERLLRRCETRRPAAGTAVAVWHEKPIEARLLTDRRRAVCRTMFETDSLPPDWVRMLHGFDRVWIPTAFHLETFTRAGVPAELLRILPETVDLQRFTATAATRPIPGATGFTFLSNFTFQERKGWRELLRAYVLEFAGDDAVTLALKLSTGFVGEREIRARLDAFIGGLGVPASRRPRIVLLYEDIPETQMPGLYTGADAYVSPTRGEGWGRPLMEALACGLPVIASRWSGQLAFLDDDCAWLVDGDVVPVPDDVDNDTFRGQRWFQPDVEALRAAMRAVASNPEAARERAASARPRLETKFGLPAIAERIAELTLEALACR
jgi:glycosyltransferase involved in cell wall biosynthesis